MFPLVFEPVFVNNWKCDPSDVVDILDCKPAAEQSQEEAKCWITLNLF